MENRGRYPDLELSLREEDGSADLLQKRRVGRGVWPDDILR